MNMQNLMAQAHKVQKEIKQKKEEIEKSEFEGKSELVTVIINGRREIKSLVINKSILKDQEDIEMLEDMIVIAFNEAIRKVSVETDKKLGMYGQGLDGLI